MYVYLCLLIFDTAVSLMIRYGPILGAEFFRCGEAAECAVSATRRRTLFCSLYGGKYELLSIDQSLASRKAHALVPKCTASPGPERVSCVVASTSQDYTRTTRLVTHTTVKHRSLGFPCQSTIEHMRLAEGWHLRFSYSARGRMRKAHVDGWPLSDDLRSR